MTFSPVLSSTTTLRPLLVHLFRLPLPYLQTLQLQKNIHEWQLELRRGQQAQTHPDVLLLLQHRPVYTSGRRQTDNDVHSDMTRLMRMGADFVRTKRGGQTTYHGPGQLVVYPLLDLGRMKLSIRDYICILQKSAESLIHDHHGIPIVPSDNTGVFVNPTTKIASIGVQVQHRLTMHGLSLNVTKEPKAWFDQVVACGLEDVKAGSVADYLDDYKELDIDDEARKFADIFSGKLGRSTVLVEETKEGMADVVGPLKEMIGKMEDVALEAGDWLREPRKDGTVS